MKFLGLRMLLKWLNKREGGREFAGTRKYGYTLMVDESS